MSSNRGMIIDGALATQMIDSSGETLMIEGADISSLEAGDGIANFEHLGPEDRGYGQEIVGKIIFAKKIFGPEDCDNDRQRLFWDKVKAPLVYGMIRLYDAAGHAGAKALAAQIRDHVANGEPPTVRYSVEGTTLTKDGNKLVTCIIRRVALTLKPCNKTAFSGLVEDSNAPEGFEKNPEEATKDILSSLAEKCEHPNYTRLGGSFESECGIIDEDSLLKSLIKIKALTALAKATEAGTYAGPMSSGGACLQREDLGERKEVHKLWKDQALKAWHDYDKKNETFDKSEFSTFLRHELPEVDDSFIDRFADLIDDYKVKVGALKKAAEDTSFDFGHNVAPGTEGLQAPPQEEPEKQGPPVLTLRGTPKPPKLFKDRGGVQVPVKNFVFDEETGTLHTPRGSLKMYIPGRDRHPGAKEAFHTIMNDPKVNEIHDRAMEGWSRVNGLLKAGKLPPEVVMHSVLFSQMSPSTPVPVQELMYSVDGDTILESCTGEKRLADFVPGDTVHGVGDLGQVLETSVVALHDHGILAGFEVEFEDGYKIVCSKDHKFLTDLGQAPLYAIVRGGLEVYSEPGMQDRWLAKQVRPCLSKGQRIQRAPQELSEMQGNSSQSQGGVCPEMAQGAPRGIQKSCRGWSRWDGSLACRTSWRGDFRNQAMEGAEPGRLQEESSSFCCGDEGVAKITSQGVCGSLCRTAGFSKEVETGAPRGICSKYQEDVRDPQDWEYILQGREMASGIRDLGLAGSSDSLWRRAQASGLCFSGPQDLGGSGRLLPLLRVSGPHLSGEDPSSRPDVKSGSIGPSRCDVDSISGELLYEGRQDEAGMAPVVYSHAPLASTGNLVLRRIVSVRYVGERHMYDLEVSHPKHNFLLPNGVVTSNSTLVDSMKEYGIDARHPNFPIMEQDWMNREKKLPQSSRGYFEGGGSKFLVAKQSFKKDKMGKEFILDERGNKIPRAAAGDAQPYMNPHQKFSRIAEYSKSHDWLENLVKKHGTDGRAMVRELMAAKSGENNIPGLKQKTGRYMAGMAGAGNQFVPDTHMVRYLFGLEKGPDSPTIDYLKSGLWRSTTQTTDALDGIDRYYFRHHDAVKHMLQSPKWGHLFKDDPEQAIFPAFWKNWAAIAPHERARGYAGTSDSSTEGTDHRPFWEAIDPFLGKSEIPDAYTPVHTARLHRHWAQQYGEMPALMMFYAHLVPHLLKNIDKPTSPAIKSELLVINLKKALSEVLQQPSRGVAVGGGQKYEILAEHPDSYVGKGKEGLVRLPKSKQGTHYDVKVPVSTPGPRPVVDSTIHGIPGLSDDPAQQQLIHGLDLGGHDLSHSEWFANNGKPVFLRSDAMEKGWGSVKAEPAYYNAARDVFGLNQYLPLSAAFRHPVGDHDSCATEGIPNLEHMDTDEANRVRGAHAFVLHHLGGTGELLKLGIMDTAMGVDHSDHNTHFNFASEPHLRLTDNGNQDGLALNNPPGEPAYLRHYGYASQMPWQAKSVPDSVHKWLRGIDFRQLESSLAKSGMPYHQADEASRRLMEMKAHSVKFGQTATWGSLLISPWDAL